MPEKIQIGHRVTPEGELRLLFKEEGAAKTFDFSLFEWMTLTSIMIGKMRDAMAEVTGQAVREDPKPDPKSDILIAQNMNNIRPLRSRKRGS